MASCRRILCFLFCVALLPTLASSIRPFRVPRSLFRQGTSSVTLPEGVRIIRREAAHEQVVETPHELEEDLRSRFRRNSPTDSPQPEETSQPLGIYDKLYMYWPENGLSKNYVFLLGKSTNSKASNPVYVSTNYGKNFRSLDLTKSNTSSAIIDQIYFSKVDANLVIFTDVTNKVLYRTTNLKTFSIQNITWVPSYITFHPWDARFVMGYDKMTEKLYVSQDQGATFAAIQGGDVKSFYWGVKDLDKEDVFFVEQFQKTLQERIKTKDNRTTVSQIDISGKNNITLATNVEEFEMMENYQFYTAKMLNSKNPHLMVAKNRKPFQEAKFPSNEESRDFFVFDVVEDRVFVVINHLKNLSNMYLSDSSGVKYQLSLPRVLYHNPFTDVSSPWLRTVVPYAFVDVDRIKSVRGVYVATQLTPGPVGRRHLLSLITYNRGGRWQRIRSPTVDNRGVRINCYLPSCSIHVNLLYGAVYRVSPSERLLSSKSAPGLVLALGVASTNLKIYPDLFVSGDGGVVWNRALRGKYIFTFGDHGGVIVAVPYRRYTRSLKYSTNGGILWTTFVFSSQAILARDVVTQPGEKLPVFLIYGTRIGRNRVSSWTVFYLNMTNVLGPVCDSTGFTTFTDGCILGRQQEFETRNWTIHCHMGRDYKRPVTIGNCQCSRDDFTCDYGFQRKNFDEECTPINTDDLDNELIPDNCPEGTNYSRSRGFRKIEGNTCVNGTEMDFLPVSTPCPIKELSNLTLSSPNVTEDGVVAVETGGTVFFRTTVLTGYQPNIVYKWFFGDEHNEKGDGIQYASRQHMYHKPGRYHVLVVASNIRSILVQKMEVNVQEKLVDDRVSISYNPRDPGMGDDVTFSVNLNYSKGDTGDVHYKWKYDVEEIQGWQPVTTLRFQKAQSYDVHITARNYVSSVKKIVQIQVIDKDVIPLNVTANVLGPTKIKITWKHAGQSGKYVTGHNIYMSTSGNTGFKKTDCESETKYMCTVNNLTPATTYYFKVSATLKGKESSMSNIAFVTTNTSTPGAPRELHAYPVNSSAIRVAWREPANTNGKITSYTIRYWPHTNVDIKKDETNLTWKVISGLAQDTVYFFEVYANSGSGRSIAVGPVQVLTKLSKPTLPPRDINMISDNGTCALVRWKPPYLSASDNRSFPAKGYKVQLPDNTVMDAPTNFAVVCKLTPGVKQDIKIWAYSEAGEGPKASATITTQIIKPGAPQNVKATVMSPSQIRLQWDPPLQSSGSLTAYLIYQLSPSKDSKPTSVPPSKTSYDVGGLEAYTTYKFAIFAKNSLGSSVKSAVVSARTLETSPGIVEYVTTETIPPYQASIKVTWSKPSKPNGNIKQYKIKWGKTVVDNPKNPDDTIIKEVDGSKTAYTFKHLTSSTYYSFVVTAVTGAGEGYQHIDPKKQRTEIAIKGTERLKMNFNGPIMDGEEAMKDFIPRFIEGANKYARILEDRIADVVVKEKESAVYFDLIPPLNDSGVPMVTAKAALNKGFSASDWVLISDSLSVVGEVSNTPAPGKPTVAALKGGQNGDGGLNKVSLAVVIPLVIIALVLIAGLLFFFVKYKNLQNNFLKLHDKEHIEDEMTEVYQEDMQADSPDVIFSDRSRKGKKVYRDSEKVPLGDSDELAMI